MNIVLVSGHMTKQANIYTNGDKVRATFTIAIDRPVKRDQDGNRPADFPNFVAFGSNAELLRDYAVKGQALEVQAHIATSTYEKDGEKQFSTNFIVDRVQLGAKPRTEAPEGDFYDEYELTENPAE